MSMPRARLTLRTFIVVLATLTHAGCGAIGSSGPSRDEAMRAGADVCRPIIAALAGYHKAHGRYPDRLGELVAAGFIDRIPEVPELGDSRRSDLTYEVSQPVDLYRLCFSYDIPEGPYAPGSIIGFTYLSDEREWVGRKYGSSLWYEASKRAATRWREKRDFDSLSAFLEVVAMRPERSYLYESRVKEWLGDGEAGTIPPSIPGGGGACTIYRVAGVGKGYGFSYRQHSLPLLDGKKSESPIVDRIYEIAGSGGDVSWKVVLDRE